MDNHVIVYRRNSETFYFGNRYVIRLDQLSRNAEHCTIEQLITTLNDTTTLTELGVAFGNFQPTPEHKLRVVEPLCRCIANLHRHNPNHPLRWLKIKFANKDNCNAVDQFLIAAKQYGIRRVSIVSSQLRFQSLVKFCRDDTPFKVLEIFNSTSIWSDESITIAVVAPKEGPRNSSAILALDKVLLDRVRFVCLSAATKFSNFMAAQVTYPALDLGIITTAGDTEEEEKIAILRLWSALISNPSLEQLTLRGDCPIEVLEVIEACATVSHIHLSSRDPPSNFAPLAVQQKLEAIASRNRNLARFVANPRVDHTGDELVALLSQLDNSPTGRYMLASCFPGIPSFFKIKTANNSTKNTAEK